MYSKKFLQSLGLDPVEFDPDYRTESLEKETSCKDPHDEESDPLLICVF